MFLCPCCNRHKRYNSSLKCINKSLRKGFGTFTRDKVDMYDKYDNDKSGDILSASQDIDVEQHDTLVASRLIELTDSFPTNEIYPKVNV